MNPAGSPSCVGGLTPIATCDWGLTRIARIASPAATRGCPKVLIVRLSAIGDVLHALPAVAALRRAVPEARIDWVVEDRAASLLEGHPALDRVLVLRRDWRRSIRRAGQRVGTVREVAGFVGSLREARYDAALDFQGNLKSGVVARLSGARARLGFTRPHVREGNQVWTTRRVPLSSPRLHRVERNLALVSSFVGRPVAYAPSDLPRPPAAVAAVDAALAAAGLPREGYAVLHPGTSGFGAFKRWPAGSFARLADRLADAGIPVALTCGPGEEPLVDAVRAAASRPAAALPTLDLLALAELLRRARVFVSCDTGPLHVAAAVGTPLLGLFGPKDQNVYGPYGTVRGNGTAPGLLPVLHRDDVPCRPCTLRWCPDPICMTSIEADDVFERLRPTLA